MPQRLGIRARFAHLAPARTVPKPLSSARQGAAAHLEQLQARHLIALEVQGGGIAGQAVVEQDAIARDGEGKVDLEGGGACLA